MNSMVLRVRRQFETFPLMSLMVGCKRPETQSSSDSSDPDVQTIAQFAGTLLDHSKDFDRNVICNIMAFNTLVYNSSKQSIDDENKLNHLTKMAKWIGVNAIVKKVKVSKYRNLSKKGEDEHSSNELGTDSKDASQAASQNASEEKWMTIIDMEDVLSTLLNKFIIKRNNERYVYDLYYVKTDEDVWFDSDKIYVQLPAVWSNPFKVLDDESESNWKNDYSNTDSDSEVNGKNRDNCEDKSTSENSDTSSFDDYPSMSSLYKIRSLHIDSSSSSSEFLSLQNSDSDSDFIY